MDVRTQVSSNSIPDTSDRLWRISDNVGVWIALMVAFWLGVLVTMFAYEIGPFARALCR